MGRGAEHRRDALGLPDPVRGQRARPRPVPADEAARPGVPDRALRRPDARHPGRPRRAPRRLRRHRPGRRPGPRQVPREDGPVRQADRPLLLRPDAGELGAGDAVPPDGLRRPDLAGQGVRQGDRRAFPVARDPRAALRLPDLLGVRPPERPGVAWRSSPGRSSAKGSGIRPRAGSPPSPGRSRRPAATSGVEIHTGVEVEAIELDSQGNVSGVVDHARGRSRREVVVSNADYVHTFRMLRGGKGFSNEVTEPPRREGRALHLVLHDPARLRPDLGRPGPSHPGADQGVGPGLRRAVRPGRVPVRPADLRQRDLRDRPGRRPEPAARTRSSSSAPRRSSRARSEARSRVRGTLRRPAHRPAGAGRPARPGRGHRLAEDHRPDRLAGSVHGVPRLDLRAGEQAQRPGRELPPAELPGRRAGPLLRRRRRPAGGGDADGRPERQDHRRADRPGHALSRAAGPARRRRGRP